MDTNAIVKKMGNLQFLRYFRQTSRCLHYASRC